MKIFDSSPTIAIEQPRRRWPILMAVVSSVLIVGLAGALVYEQQTNKELLSKTRDDLVRMKATAKDLEAQLKNTLEKLDEASGRVNSCTTSLSAETSKVAAFAKQAAACEVIRKKLNLKG